MSEDDPNLDEPDTSKFGNDAGRSNSGAGAQYGATSAEVLSPALRSLFEALAEIAPRAEIEPRAESAPRATPPSASTSSTSELGDPASTNLLPTPSSIPSILVSMLASSSGIAGSTVPPLIEIRGNQRQSEAINAGSTVPPLPAMPSLTSLPAMPACAWFD